MSHPKVSVILTHHLNENQSYLDLCVKSLLAQTYPNLEIQLIASSEEAPQALEGVTVYHRKDLNNATKKAYFGIENAHPDAEFFLFLSDDVVLSKHCIAGLAQANKSQSFIVNPMSNNENGSRFFTPLYLNNGERGIQVQNNLNREDVAGLEEQIIEFPRSNPLIIPVPWISFFCTLIPRSVYEKVGPLDEKLEVRHNDEDFCYRARKLGIQTIIELGVFALHFGSKTLSKTVSSEESLQASQYFMSKWGVG